MAAREFSFTSFQANNPTAPPPGDRLDGEFDRLARTLAAQAPQPPVRIGKNQLEPGLFDQIGATIAARVEALAATAQTLLTQAHTLVASALAAARLAVAHNALAQDAATRSASEAQGAAASAIAAEASAAHADALYTETGNAARDTAGDVATCQAYADVTYAWAEHMPDPIPPNILAVMGITGDHWSSRWWANQAALSVAGGIGNWVAGSVAFATSPTTLGQDSANFRWDDAGNRLGIGTNAPGAKLTVSANAAALQAPPADTLVQIGNADNVSNRLLLDAYGSNGNNLTLRRARGSAGSPTAVGNGDLFGTIAAIGYGASAYSSARANVSFWAAQDWTATAQGAYLSVLTTPNGTTTTAEAMRVDHTGYVGIGTTTPGAKLTVSANAAALPPPSAGTTLQVGGADGGIGRVEIDGFGVTPSLILRYGAGTAGTPAPVASGSEVGRVAAFGYGATAYSTGRAAVTMPATQNWTDAAQGCAVAVLTTPNGTAAAAEAMRVDHNGNVGIGTTAPFTALHTSRSVAGGLPATSGSTDANVFARFQGATVAVDLGVTSGGDTWLQPRSAGNFATNFPLLLNPNGGNVGIGTGTPGTAKLGVTGSATAGALDVAVAGGPNSADTTTKLVAFYDTSIATLQGAITRNGAAAVAYGTASDVRLKDNIGASDTGLKAVMALKVHDFTFKGDDRRQQGLMAQELAKIYPIAVHEGGKDPLLEPWLVDYGRLTPLLIRAIQQQQIEIDDLKRRQGKPT